jgi:hypothetical protein
LQGSNPRLVYGPHECRRLSGTKGVNDFSLGLTGYLVSVALVEDHNPSTLPGALLHVMVLIDTHE